MHNVQPHQNVRILQIEVAVSADVPDGQIRDAISGLLTESGTATPDSLILDWQYTGQERIVTASENPEEGEVFLL